MKKELSILKSLEYDIGENDVITEKSVEKLLKEKNRRLEIKLK